MEAIGLLFLCIFVFLFAMGAKRIEKTIITAPMFFLGLGYALSFTEFFESGQTEHSLHLVAEVTLIILLFLDASQIDLRALRKHYIWPERMLIIGLPLSIALGTFAAWFFLPGWPLVAVALVASLLAPTDAALGQSVVSNKRVPERVRHGLTVESGLNDGLALPIVLLFASLTAEAMGADGRNWFIFGAKQLILGPIVGIAVGALGAAIMLIAHKKELTSNLFEGVGALSLAGVAYLFAGEIGGNGFIAAFIGGLTFGNIVKGRCRFLFEFTESEGQLLMWGAFFLLGLALLPEAIAHLTPRIFGLILVSLFIVRPVAIWISLTGAGAAPPTKLFFGWFGPRGLATALFALLIIPQIGHPYAEPVLVIAINAVWISALLHGISAMPAGTVYAKLVDKKGPCQETAPIMAPFENTLRPIKSDTSAANKMGSKK